MTDPATQPASVSLTERARRAVEEADRASDAHAATWLARSRTEAARMWADVIGWTKPEEWQPVEPEPYERDHLRVKVGGIAFTQEHEYRNGQHRYWLTIPGSDARIESLVDLGRAITERKPRPWWRFR